MYFWGLIMEAIYWLKKQNKTQIQSEITVWMKIQWQILLILPLALNVWLSLDFVPNPRLQLYDQPVVNQLRNIQVVIKLSADKPQKGPSALLGATTDTLVKLNFI